MDRSKGKQPAGQLSDEELALHLWQDEVDNYNRSLEDERLARSMARAVVDDGVAITTARQEEIRASDDHRLALELSGQPVPPPQPDNQSVAVQLSEEKVKDFIDLTLADTHFDFFPTSVASQHAQAESSREPKRRCMSAHSNGEPRYECAVCTELLPSSDTIPAPCHHIYCRTCAVKLFQDSMTDETLFPPRCCRKEIPLSLVSGFLGLARTQEFEEKAIEFTDPHRTYCSNPSCSKYIFPYSVSSYIGTCTHCSSRTCMHCKRPSHEGDCPDPEDEELLQLAEREGWRRCFQCRNMIELGTGCNHITCRCGAEFCYTCGTKWRQCRCELWDENRLVDRARYLVDRGRDPAQPAQPARPEQVQEMGASAVAQDHHSSATSSAVDDGSSSFLPNHTAPATQRPSRPQTNPIDDLISQTPLVQALRRDPAYTESRPHLAMNPGLRPNHFVAGPNSGPGKITVPPYVWMAKNKSPRTAAETETTTMTTSRMVSVFHIGTQLCGHPGFVHGGLLTVMFDEAFARCVSTSFRSGLGMTANLNVDFRKPALPDRLYVLRAETVKVEGRKAWVEGTLTSLPPVGDASEPVLVAEGKALFVEPKFAESMVPLYRG
ncbi:hypothetical protein CNMCM5793_007289 [Aspergillus hiratsukae]|uniref:RING-type domain-containing protein n=1 Tax=Aspergillus hiratsukae TaxID=1194566 RepID=A0A8H6PXV9_9EURO|nr:hypothetical protein CNMCM5793_007289 [Aspergillus hiratsukae]KAF7162791.1 hypothetical protein CNMCM6106_009563 [Aspergillus hiratsukae]